MTDFDPADNWSDEWREALFPKEQAVTFADTLDLDDPVKAGRPPPKSKFFTDEQIIKIRKLHAEDGFSYKEIYDIIRHDVKWLFNQQVIRGICKGITFADVGGPIVDDERVPKFSQSEVVEIRRRANGGESGYAIAADLGVSTNAIYAIVRGEQYKDAGGPIREKKQERRFNEEQIVDLRERKAAGETRKSLAEAFDCSIALVDQICTGQIYADYSGPIRKVQPRAGR